MYELLSKALFQIEDFKASLAAVEAERDAARACKARAVECLKEIDEYDGGADSVLEDEYVTQRRMEVIEGGASSLAWIAQQRREAAAEALENVRIGWLSDNDYRPGVPEIWRYIANRAAALRAGEVPND